MSDTDRSDVAIKLAGSIVKTACSLCLGPAAGIGGTLADLIASREQDRLQRRKVQRIIDSCVDVVAEKTLSLLSGEFQGIPSNEVAAALLAVHEVFETSQVDLEQLVRLDLDPARVRKELEPATPRVLAGAALSDAGQVIFDRVLFESSAHLVEVATTLPLDNLGFRELLRRGTQIQEDLKSVLMRMPRNREDDDFTTDYMRNVVNKLDRMELFGVTLNEATRRYPLSVAYMSLNVRPPAEKDQARSSASIVRPVSTSMRVEDALAGGKRILLIGEAGCGKTTLLRWLAVGSARGSLPSALADWNDSIPYHLPLRQFADEGQFPAPEDFVKVSSKALAGEMPNQWVHDMLRKGQATVLVDGLDELPEGRVRDGAFAWLQELMQAFPEARYVVTSRPYAVKEHKLGSAFYVAEFQPMTSTHVAEFVTRWHQAIERELIDDNDREQLEGDRRAILAALDADRHLRTMAVNPLLCAMLCALNRQRQRALPTERMEVYAAALDMLLVRRDRERGMSDGFRPPTKSQVLVLQELAFWLMRQGLSDVSRDRAREVVAKAALSLPEQVGDPEALLMFLLERSGLLREPVEGRIDFVHRTFQEYLAGKAAVDGDEIELLLEKSTDDQWREVIIMAAGHAQPRQRDHLLRELVVKANAAGRSPITALIAVACLQTAPQLERSVRESVEALARELVPPSSLEAAESLVSVGALAIDELERRKPTTQIQASCSVRLLSNIGSDDALRLIGDIAADHPNIDEELLRAWRLFEGRKYAENVISRAQLSQELTVSDPGVLPFTEFFIKLRVMRLDLGHLRSLESLGGVPPSLHALYVARKPGTTVKGIERWNGIQSLTIVSVNTAVQTVPLAGMPSLETVSLHVTSGISVKFHLAPLQRLPRLRELHLNCDSRSTVDLSELALARGLSIHVPTAAQIQNRDLLGSGCQVLLS